MFCFGGVFFCVLYGFCEFDLVLRVGDVNVCYCCCDWNCGVLVMLVCGGRYIGNIGEEFFKMMNCWMGGLGRMFLNYLYFGVLVILILRVLVL